MSDAYLELGHRLRPAIQRHASAVNRFGQIPPLLGGGMNINAARLWGILLATQEAAGVTGDVGEVGVFKGYGSFLPASNMKAGETVWLVDIAGHFLQVATGFLIEQAGVASNQVLTVEGTSRDFVQSYSIVESPRWLRWVHIDGEHSKEAVVQDLDNVRDLLSRDAVVVIDDYDHPLAPSIRDGVLEWLARNSRFRLLVTGFNKAYIVDWQSEVLWDEVVERLPDLFEEFYGAQITLASMTRSVKTPYWSYGMPINDDGYLVVGGTLQDWRAIRGTSAVCAALGAPPRPEVLLFGNCQMRVLANALNAMAAEVGMHVCFSYVDDVQDLTQKSAERVMEVAQRSVGLITQQVSGERFLVASERLAAEIRGEIVLKIPSMHMNGYWPNHADLRLEPDRPTTQPTDVIVYQAVAAGWSDEDVASLLGSIDTYDEVDVLDWWRDSLSRLQRRYVDDQLDVDLAEIVRNLGARHDVRLFHIFNHPRKVVFDEMLKSLQPRLQEWFGVSDRGAADALASGETVLDYSVSSIDFVDIPPLPAVARALRLDQDWNEDRYRMVRARWSSSPHVARAVSEEVAAMRRIHESLSSDNHEWNLMQISATTLLPHDLA